MSPVINLRKDISTIMFRTMYSYFEFLEMPLGLMSAQTSFELSFGGTYRYFPRVHLEQLRVVFINNDLVYFKI